MILEPASDIVAVLSAEPQDRVLKAEAAAERGLQKAIDRFERLQQRCLGEAVPAPVSVHLSRGARSLQEGGSCKTKPNLLHYQRVEKVGTR
jgi:hypothetical protein